jgi:hypothetical protein
VGGVSGSMAAKPHRMDHRANIATNDAANDADNHHWELILDLRASLLADDADHGEESFSDADFPCWP